ncbi:amylo-alpha-1,6-glucosidase [Gorillibacterium timonense]|uniref:amylo-alpha-1,6-glucosidase n=1 Tax=Gorillibacterium timonense TaxID=1689269 RepID=UPI00071D5077|nr:amylo-alpha-1,6-glucosidase [Gorillibacterium timonense]
MNQSTHYAKLQSEILDEMKVFVPREDNRAISFTNKEAAYYYTQSHLNDHVEHAFFEGLNISKNRIFSGYTLFADHRKLDNQEAEVCVYPYKMVRVHGSMTEELWMLDYKNVLAIGLSGAQETIGIELKGEALRSLSLHESIAFFRSIEGDWVIAVGAASHQPVECKDRIVYADAAAGGFYIAVAKTAAEAGQWIRDSRRDITSLKNERVKRMESFLQENVPITSSSDSLPLALNWLNLTMDQLVTRQQGDGIYAGLPWFNEYWGRDQFIALPGAVLVTGQFETAKQILLSFAKFQNTDETSKFFGRVPNILAMENVDYHTTDGTPRFIIQLQDYVKYSGDTAIITELYPAVQASIEGSIKHWVDEKGYLMHDDNETWMDARDANHKSYSPRDTRANDIQALWYHQLRAGVYFAEYMNDTNSVMKWSHIADKLKRNFDEDYRDQAHTYLADRLNAKDEPEFSLRPNQLFALDMIDDEFFKWKATRTAWEELVYPWGVASLDRKHPFFHPYHLTSQYHKDEAYHNGAVWLWLNGIAMQRMIEAGQEETAYTLFKNMNEQALNRGVVGGLSENMDAYPQEGQSWAKLTGAYLQAWSNAEQLRVWYQYFIGIRPDLINRSLVLAPRIPAEIEDLQARVKVGNGTIDVTYQAAETEQTYLYSFKGMELTVTIDMAPFEVLQVEVESDSELRITRTEQVVIATLSDKTGSIIKEMIAAQVSLRVEQQMKADQIFRNVKFAEPLGLENHPVMNR